MRIYKSIISICLAFSMAVLPVHAEPVIIDDLNNDGQFDKYDSDIYAKYFAVWNTSDAKITNWDAADINLDGKITRSDGMELARSIAGWKDTETAEQCIVSFLLLHDNLVNNADLFHDVIIPEGNTVSRPADP